MPTYSPQEKLWFSNNPSLEMLPVIKPKVVNLITVLAYIAAIVYCGENYISQCPHCRDGMIWEKRHLYPGLRQPPNEEPLISHPCRGSDFPPLMKGCNFSCLEVEFVPNSTGQAYYYRDCSERILVEGPCQLCDRELAENYSYVNTNKSVTAYDLFDGKWTFKFCASSKCLNFSLVDELFPFHSSSALTLTAPSPIAIKVILVILGTILLLFTIKVLCSSLRTRLRMRIPTNELPVSGQMPENQPIVQRAPTPPESADTERGISGLKRPRVSFSMSSARKIVRYHKEADRESMETAIGTNDNAGEVSEAQETENPENDFTPTTYPSSTFGFKRLRTDYVWHVPSRYFKLGGAKGTTGSPHAVDSVATASSSISSDGLKTCYPGSVTANSPGSSFLSPSGRGTLPEASTADSSDAVSSDQLRTCYPASVTANSPGSSFLSATGRSTLPESTTADSSDVASTDQLRTAFPRSVTAHSPGSSFLSPTGRSTLPESTTADSPDVVSSEPMRTGWPRSVTASSPFSFSSPFRKKSSKSVNADSPKVVSTTDELKTCYPASVTAKSPSTSFASPAADSSNVVSSSGLNTCYPGSITAHSPSSNFVSPVDCNTVPLSKSVDSLIQPVSASVESSSSGWSHGYVPPPADNNRYTMALPRSSPEEDWFADQDASRDQRANQEHSITNADAESTPLNTNEEETENTETDWNPFSIESEDTDQATAESNPTDYSEAERIERKMNILTLFGNDKKKKKKKLAFE
ncbi:hypothetical protein Y032_0072g694 [Ancylostoma ceylanicum]|uniref:Uncharacterized protein n=1 Tax=Ancylostoma ceylanicum TaxID=53326 RepID=A0A016TXN5_9BILA|nr:hypothetical protein Y032_0072g694 [Ancylostoma ceylanicum]